MKEKYIEEQVAKELDNNITESEEGNQLISEEEARLNQENLFSEDFLEVEDPHPESVEEAEERGDDRRGRRKRQPSGESAH